MSKQDGGPAFPESVAVDNMDGLNYSRHTGLSLRDYFAAAALPAMTLGDHVDGRGDPERHAALAYRYADAMLKARDQ